MAQARDEAGNIWETDAQGNAVRLLSAARKSGATVSDPSKPLEVQLKGLQVQKGQQDLAAGPFDVAKARADAAKADSEAKIAQMQVEQGVTSGRMTAEVRAKALAQWAAANQLDHVIADMESKFSAGPGATTGIKGILDYNPLSPANQRFNRSSNASRGIVRNALGLTGGEANTAAEAQMNLGSYVPQATDFDSTILDSIGRLRDLRDNARKQSISTLGGVPDANGNVHPVDEKAQKKNDGSAAGIVGAVPGGGPTGPDWSWAGSPVVNGPSGPAAPVGSQTKAMDIPPQMQAELNAYLSGVPRGELKEAAFSNFMESLNKGYGFPSAPGGYSGFVKGYNTKGVPVDARIKGPEVPMGAIGGLRNDLVNNPVGAGVTGLLDAGGFGLPTMLAPDKMNALSDEHPLPFAMGQVGGAISATGGMGAIGRNTVGRAAPALLEGGANGAFLRNLATDTAYGSAYGETTQGDPLMGAFAGGIGSGAGQAAGKGLSSLLAGGGDAAARLLASRGIPLTVGQSVGRGGMFGRAIKGAEDRLAGFPVIGDVINARRLEGLKSFNEQALGDVAGQQVPSIGPEGVEHLRPMVGRMFDDATAGVTVPTNAQLGTDIATAKATGASLPPDLAERFSLAMKNRVDPILANGQMTGEQFQQMQRALKGYRAETPKAGFESDYRDALGMVSSALDNNMRSEGGGPVISGLDNAGSAYRRLKVVEDAVTRARNGSRSGEGGVFTPSQLNDASVANARRFGGAQATTQRPFYDLAQAGQDVLPNSVPDSGTAGRLAMLALPGVLGGTGYGADQLTGGDSGAMTGAALGLALTLAGTKGGQKLLTSAILKRPDAVRRVGSKIGKRQGMFGAAATPLLIEQQAP